jgi:hypothetical protein
VLARHLVIRSLPVLLACTACRTPRGGVGGAVDSHASTASDPRTSDRAYVADRTGLIEVAPSGTARVVVRETVTWCSADARARVVWFTTEDGLSAFDLDERKVHRVIAGDLGAHGAGGIRVGEVVPVIDWGNERLGGENPLAFDVGIAIAMTTPPRLAMVMGCEGDRAVYCYGEHDRPSPSVVALQVRARELELAAPAYLAALAKRGALGSLWSPAPAATPPPAPPKLDAERCTEAPHQCGELTAVPTHPLWLVVTDNSRGDYFHQSRALWAPATGEFLRVAAGKLERATSPPSDRDSSTDYGGLRVAPAGLSIDGAVFDATHVIYSPAAPGTTCGWASGGWRIPGPTG